jgi:hypothetical protein
MIAVAVLRYPAMLRQPLGWEYVLEPFGMLVILAAGSAYAVRTNRRFWGLVRRNGTFVGLATGATEVINLAVEHEAPKFAGHPAVSIGFMLLVFTMWGAAAALTVRQGGTLAAGVSTAVIGACLCMLISVATGFLFELLLSPPDPVYVATWAEFKRSGWTDPRAFGVANTLDSGFTHLLIAPIVATVVGALGSLLVRLLPRRRARRA